MNFHFNYDASKAYCLQIGLKWLGDAFIAPFDEAAFEANFTQAQVDLALQHHLTQVKWLFNAKNYPFYIRILLAVHFLLGRKS